MADRALGSPHLLAPAINELGRRIAKLEPDVVCGPLTGGAFLAFAVAETLSLRFCWSTRTPREAPSELYPYDYQVEGDLRELAGARRRRTSPEPQPGSPRPYRSTTGRQPGGAR